MAVRITGVAHLLHLPCANLITLVGIWRQTLAPSTLEWLRESLGWITQFCFVSLSFKVPYISHLLLWEAASLSQLWPSGHISYHPEEPVLSPPEWSILETRQPPSLPTRAPHGKFQLNSYAKMFCLFLDLSPLSKAVFKGLLWSFSDLRKEMEVTWDHPSLHWVKELTLHSLHVTFCLCVCVCVNAWSTNRLSFSSIKYERFLIVSWSVVSMYVWRLQRN